MRFWGFVTAWALVFAGIGQAIGNGFTVNGATVLLCGVGCVIGLVAWCADVADEETSRRLSRVDEELGRPRYESDRDHMGVQ